MEGGGMIVVDILFDRPSKIYHAMEEVSGIVVIISKTEVKHDGLLGNMEGSLRLELSSMQHVGVMQALSSTKPTSVLCSQNVTLSGGGTLKSGRTELPFKFKLEPVGSKTLFETYHGICIAIQYIFKCDVKRSFPSKTVTKSAEFLVQQSNSGNVAKVIPKPVEFTISPSSVTNVNKERNRNVPAFKVEGVLDSTQCCLKNPLSGHVIVQSCPDAQIHSIDVKLLRVETVGGEKDPCRDVSQVLTLQVAVGDICRGLQVPLYMLFPRLFTCPTLFTPNFNIEFELCLQITFASDQLLSQSFPLVLTRF